MKAIAKEFEIGRNALLNAATAVDAHRPREAERQLHALRTWCDCIIDRLKTKPEFDETRDEKVS
jgi:hypothetical protein